MAKAISFLPEFCFFSFSIIKPNENYHYLSFDTLGLTKKEIYIKKK